MTERTTFFDTRLDYLKGLGPQRAELLNKELSLFTAGDLIQYYPFRYEDRTRFYTIAELLESMPSAQVRGRLRDWHTEGEGPKKRLVGSFTDGTGTMDLVWFQGLSWLEKPSAAMANTWPLVSRRSFKASSVLSTPNSTPSAPTPNPRPRCRPSIT